MFSKLYMIDDQLAQVQQLHTAEGLRRYYNDSGY